MKLCILIVLAVAGAGVVGVIRWARYEAKKDRENIAGATVGVDDPHVSEVLTSSRQLLQDVEDDAYLDRAGFSQAEIHRMAMEREEKRWRREVLQELKDQNKNSP